MEQTLFRPSQFRLTSFSVDTRFADQYYHGTSDFIIRLPSTIRNVMRIALSSIELPQVAYVFSVVYGNTTFAVIVGSVLTPLSIPPGNYAATDLASEITGQLQTIPGLATAECLFDISNDRFSFVTGGASFVLALDSTDPTIAARPRYWGLGYNLGFRIPYNQALLHRTIVVSSTPTVATQAPAIAPPPYALVQLQCPDMLENTIHRTFAGSYVQALAKVVLRSGAYQIQFDDASNLLRKENVFQQPTSITQLRVRLLDAYGNLVDMGDTDWSMTFEIMEVINACQYAELNREYGRCA